MTPQAVASEPPRLFAVEGGRPSRSLEDVMLGALADPEHSLCPICDGELTGVHGGVRCRACGSEVISGGEPVAAWAA